MVDQNLTYSLGVIVVAAAALLLATRVLRVPTIAAYILAGIAIGPAAGLLEVTEGVHEISEVGIVLLLFLVGLELSLDKLRDVGKVALATGALQISISAAASFGICLAFGFPTPVAMLLAAALTFSSTVVVVKLLDQRKELNALHGKIAVGILLVQDLAVIVLLTFLAGLGQQAELDASALLRGMGSAFGGMLVLLLLALLASRFVLPPVFRWISKAADALFIWSLFWCFLFVLIARVLSLSPEIGAFLAGISLAQLPHSHHLRHRVGPLMNFFVAVFFVSLGIEMDVAAAVSTWPVALALTGFVILSKFTILLLVLPRFGYGERTSFLAGITLAQISEFSFILMALARDVGLVDDSIIALVSLVGIGSIAISSYLILFMDRLYEQLSGRGLLRVFGADAGEDPAPEETIMGHVVVVGMNALGHALVQHLVAQGETVLAIDTDPEKLAGLPCETLLGNVDYSSILEEARLPDAKMLVSCLQIEETNQLLAYRAKQLDIPSSIHAFDPAGVAELREIGVSHLLMSKNVGIRRLAREVQKSGVLQSS